MKKIIVMLTVFALCFSMAFANGSKEATPAAASSDGSTMNIAILLKTLADPFWVDMAEGIKAEAASQGIHVDVYAVDSEADIDGQLKKMEDIVNSGSYDGIGIAPITGTNLITGLVSANKKGIPVVNIDAKIDEEAMAAAGGYVVGFATSDNYRIGQMAADYVTEKLSEGGKVAIIEGRAGDLSSMLRCGGFSDQIAKNSKFVISDSQPADWDRQKALDVATNIITKSPDVKAFFVANNTMALGVLQAINNTGKIGKILLVGTDASDETYQAISAGQMVAVCQSPADIGATCFNILVDAVKAGNKGIFGNPGVEKLVPATLVTK